jgi:hypothetical protein
MFDSTVNLSGTAGASLVRPTPVPGTLPAPLSHKHPSVFGPTTPGFPGRGEPSGTRPVSGPGLASPTEATAEEPWPKAPQEVEKKRRYVCPTDQGSNWLMGEPHGWIGRKVRNRGNAAVYMVRQVFKNGRVQLERNWMSYVTDVETIREKYEPQV